MKGFSIWVTILSTIHFYATTCYISYTDKGKLNLLLSKFHDSNKKRKKLSNHVHSQVRNKRGTIVPIGCYCTKINVNLRLEFVHFAVLGSNTKIMFCLNEYLCKKTLELREIT